VVQHVHGQADVDAVGTQRKLLCVGRDLRAVPAGERRPRLGAGRAFRVGEDRLAGADRTVGSVGGLGERLPARDWIVRLHVIH